MHDQLFNLIIQKVVLTDNDKFLCEKYFEPVLFLKTELLNTKTKFQNIYTLLYRVLGDCFITTIKGMK